MLRRTALVAAARLAGCASSPDSPATANYQPKQYRTGSNIPVGSANPRDGHDTFKPDDVPLSSMPWQYKKGPGGANY